MPFTAVKGSVRAAAHQLGSVDAERTWRRVSSAGAICLVVSGCAAFVSTGSARQDRPELVPPDEKKLSELVDSAFQMAKLSGTPEMSALHVTQAPQIGDWMFCLKSSAPNETQRYAVFILGNAIKDIRSGVLIDGCYKDTYRPIRADQSMSRTD